MKSFRRGQQPEEEKSASVPPDGHVSGDRRTSSRGRAVTQPSAVAQLSAVTQPQVCFIDGKDEEASVQAFFQEHWKAADDALFGPDQTWGHLPLTVGAWDGARLVGAAAGTALAQIARLDDLLVAEGRRNEGIGSRLLEAFCVSALAAGAQRCFVRCPATVAHERFYLQRRFSVVAVIPRYYFGRTFLECVRDLRMHDSTELAAPACGEQLEE